MHPGDAGRLAPEGASAPAGPGGAPGGGGGGQSRMDNFRKVKTSEQEEEEASAASGTVAALLPFPDLPSGVVEMKVKEGSKIRNLMGFAMGRMALDATRQIVFSGCGRAVTKTITCVEIMKRKLGGLHQVTKVRYKGLVEVWESSREPQQQQPGPAVERLTVHKNVPAICILLSKDPLDPNQMGYQPPGGPSEGLWADEGGAPDDTNTANSSAASPSSPTGVKRRQAAPPLEAEQLPKKAQCLQAPDGRAAAWGTFDGRSSAPLAQARPCPPGWHNCERAAPPSQL